MNKKIVVSSFLGNALEFYDFTLYGVFATLLATQFFPSSNPLNGLLASWGAFAAGFIMRPFGATVFGFIGDKLGRKKALSLSIIGMGIPTLILGLLPTYEVIGIAAPLLLIACRMLQGLCTGGEYNGAAIFSLEHHRSSYGRGFISGLITSSCVLGALSATMMGFLIFRYIYHPWGWRIAFILGAGISLIGFIIRHRMTESPEFIKESPQNYSHYFSHLYQVIKSFKEAFLMTFLFGALNGALSYSLFGFLNVYLNRYLGIPIEKAMFVNLFGLGAFMMFCPLAGYFLDKKKDKYFLKVVLSCIMIFPLISYYFLSFQSLPFLILGQIFYGCLVGLVAGPQHALVLLLFPVKYRYTGISFSFSLGMGIGGGLMPFISLYLIEKTHNLYLPALSITLLGIGIFVSYFLLCRKQNFQTIDNLSSRCYQTSSS